MHHIIKIGPRLACLVPSLLATLLLAACRTAGNGGEPTTIAAPTGLSAAPGGYGEARLFWTPSTSAQATHQTVIAGTTSGELSDIGLELDPGIDEHTVAGLDAGAWYFAVRAHGPGGATSAPSAVVSVEVTAPPEPEPTLDPPANLVVHPGADGQVFLWWTPSEDEGATGQQIMFGADPDDLEPHALPLSADDTSAGLSGLPWGQTVHFAVRAVGPGGATSMPSTTVSIQIPGLPPVVHEPEPGTTFRVQGSSMGNRYQSLVIDHLEGGSYVGPVAIATVEVNGVSVPWSGDNYHLDLGAALPAGEMLALTVVIPGAGYVITAEGAIPDTPTLVFPGDGHEYAANEPMQIEWQSTADPDRFEVRIHFAFEAGGFGAVPVTAPGAVRGVVIHPRAIPPTADPATLFISVSAVNDGEFTAGPFSNDSAMNVRVEAPVVDITLGGP